MKLFAKSRPAARILSALCLMPLLAACAGLAPQGGANSPASAYKAPATATPAAPAPAPASKFPEKDITLVVPFSPGGGYDTLARGLVPYLQKHLPNKVNIIVENRTGGSGQTGTAYVATAKPDGYTIYLGNMPGLVASQVINDKPPFDLSKFTWLGRLTVVNNGLAVSGKSTYKSVDDLKKKGDVLFAGADIGDAATAYLAFAKMGIKARFLPHNGSGEATTSVLRGDADITYFSLSSLVPYAKSGDLRVLVQYTESPLAELNAPTATSLGFAGLSALAAQQRVIGAPPGLPADIAAILETALQKAVADPDYVKWAEGVKQPAAWLSAKETTALVKEAVDLMNANADTLKQNLGRK